MNQHSIRMQEAVSHVNEKGKVPHGFICSVDKSREMSRYGKIQSFQQFIKGVIPMPCVRQFQHKHSNLHTVLPLLLTQSRQLLISYNLVESRISHWIMLYRLIYLNEVKNFKSKKTCANYLSLKMLREIKMTLKYWYVQVWPVSVSMIQIQYYISIV